MSMLIQAARKPQVSEGWSWSAYLPKPQTLLKAYNLGVAFLVSYDYVTNPNQKDLSLREYGFDVIVHTLHGLLPSDAPQLAKEALAMLDVTRIIRITASPVIGSTIPTSANIVDIGNHALNIYALQH